MQTKQITAIKGLTTKAQKLFADLTASETTLQSAFDRRLERSWQFGKLLNELKELVPHGDWENYRTASFKGLSDRVARQCQKLDHDNPKALKLADLSAESVRKFRYGYVPAKERAQLKGNVRFSKPSHHSSLVNEQNKFMQRVKAGHVKLDVAEFLRDSKDYLDWCAGLAAGRR